MATFWPIDAAAVAALTGGELVGSPGAKATRLALDTRAGVRTGDLFVALSGARFDGGRFANDALNAGAAVALVSAAHDVAPGPGQAVVRVSDPLGALHALAREARRRFEGRVVAVTGSNGKTIVKDQLMAALATSMSVTGSPLSYNSQVGVPAALLGLNPGADVAVVECGISRPGEMERLARLVDPDVGVFVNVGEAHLEGLGTRVGIAHEKSVLFSGSRCRCVFVPSDQTLAIAALERQHTCVERVWVERGLARTQNGPSFDAPTVGADDPLEVDAGLSGVVALWLGADPALVRAALAVWRPPAMRLEITTTPRGVMLINDAYVSDPSSAEQALRRLAAERGSGRLVAVLGGFAQLGSARAGAHATLGRRVAELGIDRLIAVGNWGSEIAESALAAGMAPGHVVAVDSVAEAAPLLEQITEPGDRVLLKGSRPERLEAVAAALFDALAPTRLTVDLDAIRANFGAVKAHVGAGVAVMPVVKAFGYGMDASRLARTLEQEGADAFVVAYPDEGVQLRERGVLAPIVVQNVLPQEVDKVVRHGLSSIGNSLATLDLVSAEAARQQRAARIHLKIDTGMGRAGVFAHEALGAARRVVADPWLVLDGLMTHLAASESPESDAFTALQLARFTAVVDELRAAGIRPRWVHAANSSAIARHPTAMFTMVRLGIGLFGYADNSAALRPQPALRLVTRLVSVKELPAGHAVGYGHTFRVGSSPRMVAVAAIGYADGYPLALSNRFWMSVAGQQCPIVGRVCMDVTMIDVTDVRPAPSPGDEVVVFGPAPNEPSLRALAEEASTIPYEILTGISPRVRRIFVGEA